MDLLASARTDRLHGAGGNRGDVASAGRWIDSGTNGENVLQVTAAPPAATVSRATGSSSSRSERPYMGTSVSGSSSSWGRWRVGYLVGRRAGKIGH
jgi:hypothetical protein